MARLMSFILAVFILVPVLAPSIGAVLTDWVSWRGTFAFAGGIAVVLGIWAWRLPETLSEANRREVSLRAVWASARFVLSNRTSVMLTFALTFMFGAFLSYVASSEIIFTDVFGEGDRFPIIFGGVALMLVVGMLANSWMVGRFGLVKLINTMVTLYVIASTGLALIGIATGGVPPLWVFLVALATVVLFQSFLIPNLNTVAMIPMGAVAGVASAVIGTVSTGLAAVVGAIIDNTFDGTVLPLSIGFGAAAWVAFLMVRSARMQDALDGPTPEGAARLDALMRTAGVIKAETGSGTGSGR